MRLAAFTVSGVLAVAGMAFHATAASYDPNNLSANEADRISAVCQTVIGVRPGEKHFNNCVTSLSASVRDFNQSLVAEHARSDCLARGLPSGGAALAECTLQGEESRAASGGARGPFASTADAATSVPGGDQSYFSVSTGDVHRREQLACARLGFDPTGRAFVSCVANLQASLFAADHPMN